MVLVIASIAEMGSIICKGHQCRPDVADKPHAIEIQFSYKRS